MQNLQSWNDLQINAIHSVISLSSYIHTPKSDNVSRLLPGRYICIDTGHPLLMWSNKIHTRALVIYICSFISADTVRRRAVLPVRHKTTTAVAATLARPYNILWNWNPDGLYFPFEELSGVEQLIVNSCEIYYLEIDNCFGCNQSKNTDRMRIIIRSRHVLWWSVFNRSWCRLLC